MKKDTRQDIVDAFVGRVENASLSKVRIAELISTLGINRNTFYYYFSNKQDVAMYVLRTDLDFELRSTFPERELICAPCFDKDDEPPLAYYIHVETGARTLDASGFMRSFVRAALSRPAFYRKLFNAQEPDFSRSVASLYWPVIEHDIDFILDGRYLPAPMRRLFTNHSARYIISTTRFCLEDNDGASLLDDRTNPFWNILHESLYNAIQAHPVNRYAKKTSTPPARFVR